MFIEMIVVDLLTKQKELEEMSKEFPLIKELGLHVFENIIGGAVQAKELERLLKAAPRVYSHDSKLGPGRNKAQWYHDEMVDASQGANCSALLIGIKEIKEDTAEDVLSDFIKWGHAAIEHRPLPFSMFDLEERAKKVLESK